MTHAEVASTQASRRLERDIALLRQLHTESMLHVSNVLRRTAAAHGITIPPFCPLGPSLGNDHTRAMTQLAHTSGLSLCAFVRLVRGESTEDPRPNKQLHPVSSRSAPHLADQWNEIVQHGVRPRWSHTKPNRQGVRPENHGSVAANAEAVRRHLRKGACDGRYLVLESSILDVWPEIFVSPLGVVEKTSPDGNDIRVINDYSYPDGTSVNDFTVCDDHPTITYNPPRDIARRINSLRTRYPSETILMMLGDVSGAFRHVPMDATSVHMFAFRFDDHVVIDLACGFGWCGSPAFYSLAGSLINALYEATTPSSASGLDDSAFVGNVWCDDHTCVEIDTGDRCFDANLALRRAMVSVLGPTAINEKKFTAWSTRNKALGLVWDTGKGTVSIPSVKLDKAYRLVTAAINSGTASSTELKSLLGVLRHVVVCFPPARAFYQRLHQFASSFNTGRRQLPDAAAEDLRLFAFVLRSPQHFNGVSLEQLLDLIPPSVHVYMDASNSGLCALEPVRREYIRHRFTDAERISIVSDQHDYSINVRELQSAVLAVVHWGQAWRSAATSTAPIHVRLHIDNTSAVAWANRRASKHAQAQLFLRLLSAVEFKYRLIISAEHIKGELNAMADAGSRAWDASDTLWDTWTHMRSGWRQVCIQEPFDRPSAAWAACYNDTLWLTPPTRATAATGDSGASSAASWDGRGGSTDRRNPNDDYSTSPSTCGVTAGTVMAAETSTRLSSSN